VPTGGARLGPKMSLSPHRETYCMDKNQEVNGANLNFEIFIVSVVKICKQSSAKCFSFWGTDPPGGLRSWTQLDYIPQMQRALSQAYNNFFSSLRSHTKSATRPDCPFKSYSKIHLVSHTCVSYHIHIGLLGMGRGPSLAWHSNMGVNHGRPLDLVPQKLEWGHYANCPHILSCFGISRIRCCLHYI